MNADYRCVADLGTVGVAVTTDTQDLIDYLADFYPLRGDGEARWAIDARLGQPGDGMALTPWQVGYRAEKATRRLVIRSTDPRNLAITTRKAIWEVLLDYCEAHRYTMLHASAVADDDQMIVVVGDKGSGKTTLALNGALGNDYHYLSNDHLILYRSPNGLAVTSLPTPLPIKIGTYLDYAERLGEPWENEDLDIESFRAMPPQQRYGYDRRLLFTYRGVGHANPVHTKLIGRRVVVVLASYAGPGEPATEPTVVDDPVAALWPHVRFDWVFDPALNTHHLPRAERDRDDYAADSRARLTELATASLVLRWRHHGSLAPLTRWLATRPGGVR